MSMPVKHVVLYDQTGAADAALDTGALNTADYDMLFVEEVPSGAAAAGTITFYDPDFSTVAILSLATNADANPNFAGWGPGTGTAVLGRYRGGLASTVPGKSRFVLSALGAGVTGRMRIVGIRNHRGPDVASIQD